MTEPEEGDRTDRDAQAQLDPADRQDQAGVGRSGGKDDAERFGVEIGGNADQHGGEADERVEARHQLRHVGHLDLARDDPAEPAANGDRRR